MIITKISAKKLYGYLDFEARLENDLNIFVGINGTGKTSAINVIEWLTKPNILKLTTEDYISISVELKHNDIEYKISSAQLLDRIIFSLETNNEEIGTQEVFLKKGNNHEITVRGHLAGLFESSLEAAPSSDVTLQIAKYLKELPPITIVSLERLMKADIDEISIWEKVTIAGNKSKHSTPIDYVQNLFKTKLQIYREKTEKNDIALKNAIMLAALSSPEKNINDYELDFSVQGMETLKARILNLLNFDNDNKTRSAVDDFFSDFHHMYYFFTDKNNHFLSVKDNPIIKLFKQQAHRVYQIIGAVNSYEAKKNRDYEKISHYLNVVNKFLRQTGKYLIADEASSKLFFTTSLETGVDKKHKASRRKSNFESLNKLSSGEMQIVVLFGLLAFNSNPNSVFIVDEPELSLHPYWQRMFMEAFLELCPIETQLIVATHSPELVGANKSKCVVFGVN